MPTVNNANALYDIPPVDDPSSDRDFGFDLNASGDQELVFWQSTAHPSTPTQAEIDAAEAGYSEDNEVPIEEQFGFPLEDLAALLGGNSSGVNFLESDGSTLPPVEAGAVLLNTPDNRWYRGYKSSPAAVGEWWSTELFQDSGGYNGLCANNTEMRRYDNRDMTFNTGIPVEAKQLRLMGIVAKWEQNPADAKLEIMMGTTSVSLEIGAPGGLQQTFLPWHPKYLITPAQYENIWVRFRSTSNYCFNPQFSMYWRYVLIP